MPQTEKMNSSYIALLCSLGCLVALLAAQIVVMYTLYRNTLAFEGRYLHDSVRQVMVRIDIMRESIRSNREALGQEVTEQEIKQIIEDTLRQEFYRTANPKDGSYMWINEVRNYEGGKAYGIRLIHPNLKDSEGAELSTFAMDAKGELPYLKELEGIKGNGSILYSYYFRDLEAETVSRKLTYAALYPAYDWIICMGIPYNAVWGEGYWGDTQLKWAIGLAALIAALGIVGILFYMMRLLREERRLNAKQVAGLHEQIDTDGLTGASSRRYGEALLSQRLHRFHHKGENICVALFDIDHFKEVNDTFGHEFGDIVLQGVVSRIEATTRKEDCLIRWGGDEFLIVFSHLSPKDTAHRMDRLNECIREEAFYAPDGREKRVTISIGIARFRQEDKSVEQMLQRADAALYEAKSLRDGWRSADED